MDWILGGDMVVDPSDRGSLEKQDDEEKGITTIIVRVYKTVHLHNEKNYLELQIPLTLSQQVST